MQPGERSRKSSPLAVVTYEIDMLNHAWRQLEEAQPRKDHTSNAWQEVYLLHYRNLIEFFGKDPNYSPRTRSPRRRDPAEDMHYLVPRTWTDRDIARMDLLPAFTLAEQLHASYWQDISRFLQHCTDWRHARTKVWGYPTMHPEITAVIEAMYVVLAKYGIPLRSPEATPASGRCPMCMGTGTLPEGR